MTKHGIYQRNTQGETVYDFYWLGDLVNEVDFNERLRSQTRSAMEEVGGLAKSLKEAFNAGDRTVAELDLIEKILALSLCPACRTLIAGKAGP